MKPRKDLSRDIYKQFLENLQATAYQAVISGPDQYEIQEGNHESLTGYPAEYFSSEKYLQLIYEEDRDRVMAYNHRLQTEPDFENEITYRIVARSGELKWVKSFDRHYLGDQQQHIIQGVIFDVTQMKEQELALQEAYETIREQMEKSRERVILADRMEGLATLVSGVFHEMSNPIGNARLLGTDMADKAGEIRKLVDSGEITREELGRFIDSVDELGGMIDSVLGQAVAIMKGFRMVAADEATVKSGTIAIGDYLRDIRRIYEPKVRDVRHELVLSVETNRRLRTVPGYVTQIVLNLLNNALIHAFPEGQKGRVDMIVRENSDGDVEISVEDNGPGIPEPERSRVFEMHYTTSAEGTGLGLGISRSLAEERLNGELKLESSNDGGSRFVLVLRDLAG